MEVCSVGLVCKVEEHRLLECFHGGMIDFVPEEIYHQWG
jgi:hypothetical protein